MRWQLVNLSNKPAPGYERLDINANGIAEAFFSSARNKELTSPFPFLSRYQAHTSHLSNGIMWVSSVSDRGFLSLDLVKVPSGYSDFGGRQLAFWHQA